MQTNFIELSPFELQKVDGGSDWEDVFEKISPIGLLEFTYQVGQDIGAASVKFGRECYDFYCDVKEIFS